MRQRFVRSFQWLLPGVGVKRWILLAVFGIVLLLDGVTRWFIAEGSGIHVNETLDSIVVDYFSPAYLTGVLGTAGIVFLGIGVFMWMRTVARIAGSRQPKGFRDALAGRPTKSWRSAAVRGSRRCCAASNGARAISPPS
jgi:hypothetical protein